MKKVLFVVLVVVCIYNTTIFYNFLFTQFMNINKF